MYVSFGRSFIASTAVLRAAAISPRLFTSSWKLSSFLFSRRKNKSGTMERGNLSFCNDKIMNTLDHQSIQSIFNFPKRSTLRQDLSKLSGKMWCRIDTVDGGREIKINKRNNKVVIGYGPDVSTPILFVKAKCCKMVAYLNSLSNATRSSAGRRRIFYLVVCARSAFNSFEGFFTVHGHIVEYFQLSSLCIVWQAARKCDR